MTGAEAISHQRLSATELSPPEPHDLVADFDAAFVQLVLDVAMPGDRPAPLIIHPLTKPADRYQFNKALGKPFIFAKIELQLHYPSAQVVNHAG